MAGRPDGRDDDRYALPLGQCDGIPTIPLFELERTGTLLTREEAGE